MLDYAGLHAVSAVIQEGSFDKAAQKLAITASAVSQRVKLLEERLGAVLIIRGQPCKATPEGELICRHVEQVRILEHSLSKHLPHLMGTDDEHSQVTIPVVVNADSLDTWFIEAASMFTARTGYLLNISIDDQTHTAEWLKMGRVAGAVTAHGRAVQGCKSMPLGSMRYHAAASPAFMAQYFPDGVTVASLKKAPSLVFDSKDKLQEQWVQLAVGQQLPLPVHRLPSTHGFIAAGLKGLGWGVSPSHLLAPYFENGSLVELIPDLVIDLPLFWQIRGIAADQLSALTNSIAAAARAHLSANSEIQPG